MRLPHTVCPNCGHYQGREVIEIKVKRAKQSMETLIAQGIEQTQEYMDRCQATHGHLMVFDAESNKSCDERIFTRALSENLTLWGC